MTCQSISKAIAAATTSQQTIDNNNMTRRRVAYGAFSFCSPAKLFNASPGVSDCRCCTSGSSSVAEELSIVTPFSGIARAPMVIPRLQPSHIIAADIRTDLFLFSVSRAGLVAPPSNRNSCLFTNRYANFRNRSRREIR